MGRRKLWMSPNSRKLFIHLVTRLLYNNCYWYTLFHSNIITQRVKMSNNNIENHKTIAMEHELKNEGHLLKEKKKMILKAVGRRSENPKEPVLMWGHSGGRKYQEVCKPDLSPLEEIGLTNQPKSGGKCPHPVPPALVVERKLDIDQSNHYSPLNSVSCLPCRLKREKQIPVLQKSQKTRPNFPYVSFSIFFTNCQKSILGYRHDGRWS